MAKSEVYSWRLNSDLKTDLDLHTRLQGKTLAEVLNMLAKGWLEEQKLQNSENESEQARLHAIAARFVGSISGGDPHASQTVREVVRQRIRERNAH